MVEFFRNNSSVKRVFKIFFIFCILLFVIFVLYILKNNNPETTSKFPPCFFYKFIGIKCAGCGLTRATYYILNLNFKKAFFFNPLIFLYIAYIIYFNFRYIICKMLKKKISLDNYTCSLSIVLIISVLFVIVRNTGVFTFFL